MVVKAKEATAVAQIRKQLAEIGRELQKLMAKQPLRNARLFQLRLRSGSG
jgi:hypothetical protein